MRMSSSLHDYARKRLQIAAKGLPKDIDLAGPDSPWFVAVDETPPEAAERGPLYTTLSHYDYLSLARHPKVLAAAKQAVDDYGVGVGASRLIGGERSIHRAFEAELADFLGTEAALGLGTGYMVGLTLIPHLVGSGDLIVMDELTHSSSLHGAKATRATVRLFRHGDLDHLTEILDEERDKHGFCLIVAEGIYSMDGDVVDLPRLLEIRDRWQCWLMIDEAHSIGVIGATGRGVCEYFGIEPSRVDIIVGTLSKTFVSMGGFLAGRRDFIDWIRFTLPSFVFSVGLSPVIVQTARAALSLLRHEPERVARLQQNSMEFRQAAQAAGFDTGDSIGCGIVPVLFKRQETALAVSHALRQEGIYAPPIVQVGLGNGLPRIRFFLSADVRKADLDRTLGVMIRAVQSVDPMPGNSAG